MRIESGDLKRAAGVNRGRPARGRRTAWMFVGVAMLAGLLAAGCSPRQGNDLNAMEKGRLTIKDNTFEVWIARTPAQRQRGLMFVPPDKLEDTPDGAHRGMLFIFEQQKPLSFYMKNTITPLDIAYINTDGGIVRTHSMKPLDERSYPSGRPARYALEVQGNLFKKLGIGKDDHVEIPDSVLKGGR